MAIIRLENVEVSYGRTKALRGVSCEVEGGAIGLLGPNGAGKSTLLKTLLGFIRPDSGIVELAGFRLPEKALEVRQRIGYMPEKDITARKVSAVSFLTYCGCLFGMKHNDAMERAHEVLNYVGLKDSRYRKMQTYSTGMCQRVKFAQALVHDPKLILLDEPTNGLDPEGRIEMLELIRELVEKRGVTVMLSSHLLPDVEHVCERIIMIAKGKIVKEGLITDLTTKRDNLFELRVRGNEEQFMRKLENAACELQLKPNGTMLVDDTQGIAAAEFFEIAGQCGAQVRHFMPVRHKLEEIFMQAIGEK